MWVPDGTLKEQLKRIFTRYKIVFKINKDVITQQILRNQNTRKEEERFGGCDSEEEGCTEFP